jgi:5-methylcytosine-specific restriction endonuclease McrA
VKKIFSVLLIGILLSSGVSFARSSSYYKGSYKPYTFKTYTKAQTYKSTYKPYSVKSYTKTPTYKSGNTTYYIGKTYKTTGLPKVKRSETAKEQFLRNKGLKRIPKGYQIDHITPLSKGGADNPENMQLLPLEVHKQKTKNERLNLLFN